MPANITLRSSDQLVYAALWWFTIFQVAEVLQTCAAVSTHLHYYEVQFLQQDA